VATARSGDLGAVFMLYGDDPDAVGRCLGALRSRLLVEGMEAFDHEVFEGRTLDAVGPVLQALGQPPMASERRLVELVDPDEVGAKKASGDAKAAEARAAMEALVAYLERPNDRALLVLVAPGLDGRSRLVKAAAKAGHAFRLGPLGNDRAAMAFVRDEARARGIALAPGAAEAVVEAAGLVRALLVSALETAALHNGAGRVTTEDVAAVVPESRQTVVFALTDAVGRQDVPGALAVLRRVFADRSTTPQGIALQLVALLAHQVRNLAVVRHYGPQGGGRLSLPPFVLRKLAGQAARWGPARLRAAHRGLVALDRALKRGTRGVADDPRGALARWILETAGVLDRVS